jgi:Mg-chelatase subunit ChlD
MDGNKKAWLLAFLLIPAFIPALNPGSALAGEIKKNPVKKLVLLWDTDQKTSAQVSEAEIRKEIASILEKKGTFSSIPAGTLKDESGLKSDIKQAKYPELARKMKSAFPEGGVMLLYVSVFRDLELHNKGYITYLFFDPDTNEKYYSFLEKPVDLNVTEIMNILGDVVTQSPDTLNSKVEVYKPISILFLVDNSGSMKLNDNDFNPRDQIFHPRETARANAVRLMLNKLMIKDEFSVIYFSGKVDALSDAFIKIKDRRQLSELDQRILDKIEIYPGTDIGEAFKKTADILRTAATTNLYIILLTDGSPTQGETSLAKLRDFARKNFRNAPMFVIGLEGAGQDREGYVLQKGFLKDLAYDSDGMFYIVKIRPPMDNRYAEISMVVDNIMNYIRKEQTIVNQEAEKRTVVQDKVIHSWDFDINSSCSEFSILIEPFEDAYVVEVIGPDGKTLPKENVEITRLAHAASCRITYPDCKGQWKLNVKVPQKQE